jgi:hypothetical protein
VNDAQEYNATGGEYCSKFPGESSAAPEKSAESEVFKILGNKRDEVGIRGLKRGDADQRGCGGLTRIRKEMKKGNTHDH